jgi:hypothetical protein
LLLFQYGKTDRASQSFPKLPIFPTQTFVFCQQLLASRLAIDHIGHGLLDTRRVVVDSLPATGGLTCPIRDCPETAAQNRRGVANP